jgi:hypothetical protein
MTFTLKPSHSRRRIAMASLDAPSAVLPRMIGGPSARRASATDFTLASRRISKV